MIGVIDSGAGGVLTAGMLSTLLPRADITLFADRKNAPYGTKSPREIAALTERAIMRLVGCGAERVLIGCCTASSAYALLSDKARERSIPIITPTAERAARVSTFGRIGVLATEATVASGEFERAIRRTLPSATVVSLATPALVSLVERGVRDGRVVGAEFSQIRDAVAPLLSENIDTLVLGCTHFPYLEGTLGEIFGGVKTVSCAREGAHLAVTICGNYGRGRLCYLE